MLPAEAEGLFLSAVGSLKHKRHIGGRRSDEQISSLHLLIPPSHTFIQHMQEDSAPPGDRLLTVLLFVPFLLTLNFVLFPGGRLIDSPVRRPLRHLTDAR